MKNKPCPLCGRLLGGKIEEHHLIPKTFKGKETEPIHKICHQKIHSIFSERELKNEFNSWDKIKSHNEIIKFIEWIKNKSLDFYVSSKDSKIRKSKR